MVEDACQAVGARYKGRPVGTLGGLGTLSFYPTKNLGALGDGGAILASDPEVAAKLRRLRNGGQSDRYRHEVAGINSRLDEIQAAILRVGLRHLAAWTKRRRALAASYRRGLDGLGLVLPVEEPYAEAVEHLFVVRHPRRDALAAGLADARGRHPHPLPDSPAPPARPRRAEAASRGDFPVAEAAAREVLSLPLYPGLTDAQAQAVVEAVRATLREIA